MSTSGGFDGDSLDIFVRGHDEASSSFQSAWDAAERAGAGIVSANEKIEQAGRAAQAAVGASTRAIEDSGTKVVEVGQKQQRVLDELKERFAAIGDAARTASRAASGDLEALQAQLAQTARALQAIKDDARAGIASPQQRVNILEGLRQQTLGGSDRETLQARYSGGDVRVREQYTQLVAIEKELQNARKQTADVAKQTSAEEEKAQQQAAQSIVESAKSQTTQLRDQVRLRQISLEEEAAALTRYREQYAANADAIAIIDRRQTANQIEQMRERDRTQRERQGGSADALLNAGYLLPGGVGNTLTNLGYLGMGGPTALAIGGAAVAGIGVASGIAQVGKIAGEDQEALERLQIAVNDSGQSFAAANKEIEEFIRLQTQTTEFGRDETVPAIEQLVTGGLKYADALKVVRVAEDASAGSGKSLSEVTTALLRAYEGQPRALTALGLATKDAERAGLSFADVLGIVEKRYGGQATATDTYERSQKQLQNAIRDLESQIGTGLLPTLTDATKGMTHFTQSVDGASVGQGIADYVKEIAGIGKALDDLYHATKPVVDLLNTLEHLSLGGLKNEIEGAAIVAKGVSTPVNQSVDEYGNVYVSGRGSAPAPAAPNVEDAIATAAAKYPASGPVPLSSLLRAVGQQETGLGSSPVYDPITGLSRTPGNAGRGIFQLDPSSGASQADLDKAASSVAFAADRAAKMLAAALKATGGNLDATLSTYHSGGLTTAGLQYARKVEALIPGYNPADTNVSDPQRIGGGATQSPFQQELTSARLTEFNEQNAGVAQYRQNYIEALQAILAEQHAVAADSTKSAQERAAASKNEETVQQKIAAAQREENAAANAGVRLAEQKLTLAERNADTARRAQQSVDPVGAYQREIATLTALQTQRGNANDIFSARDVEEIGTAIERLKSESDSTWKGALSDATRYYKNSSETLDEYIARVRNLERGAGDNKTLGEASITSAIEKSVSTTISNLDKAYRQAVENGASRSALESLLQSDRTQIGSLRNYGDKTAGDEQTAGNAAITGKLGGLYDTDASKSVTSLTQQYKELADAVNSSNAAESTKEAELASITAAQIASLIALGKQYQALGKDGVNAYDSISAKIDELKVTEQQQLDQAAKAERDELQKRAEEYQQFADTASAHLAGLFEKGTNGANGFRDAFKSAIKDIEQSLVSNALESAIFGVQGSASTSPTAAFEKAIFGAVDPNQTGAKASVSDAALQKIANSPTGGQNDPITVRLSSDATQSLTGTPTGVQPGSATANAATTAATGLAGLLGGGAGSLLGLGIAGAGLLASGGSGGTPSNQPDRTNTNQYGQTIADLIGSAGANGQNFYEDPATEKAFGGLSGIAGVERLLSFGPTAFTQQTGLSAAQYAQYLQMFGSSVSGSGTLQFNPNNIGIESVTGAAGASGSYTYQQFQQALQAIEGGLSTLGSTGPINSYTFSRNYPNANQIGSPQSGLYLPTQVTGGPGYAGPSVSDITAGAQQYGLVGGLLGTRGGSSLLGALSTSAGVIGLLLGTATSQQLAGQSSQSASGASGGANPTNSLVVGNANAASASAASDSGSPDSYDDYVSNAIAQSLVASGASGVGALGGLGVPGGGVVTAAGILSGSGLTDTFRGAGTGPYGLGGSSTFGSIGFGQDFFPAGGSLFDATLGTGISGGLAGLGVGSALASLDGGNSTNGSIGGALGGGVGSIIGGPVGGLVGSVAGGLLGSLFGNHTTPAGSPDIYNTQQYGTITADLLGANGANGQNFYEDAATYKAFNGLTGLAGVEELLSGGQKAFTEETGLSSAQYAQYLAMFGASATGSGTLNFQKNIGQEDVTGATGANGIYSYLQYGQALAAIESGLAASGVTGPYDSYTISRSYPNYNAATLAAAGNSTTNPTVPTTGGATTSKTGSASSDLITGTGPVNGTPVTGPPISIHDNIFVGSSSETAAQLATLIQKAQQNQARGLAVNTASSSYARVPTT